MPELRERCNRSYETAGRVCCRRPYGGGGAPLLQLLAREEEVQDQEGKAGAFVRCGAGEPAGSEHSRELRVEAG